MKLKSEIIGEVVEKNLEAALSGVEEWFDAQLLKKRGLIGRREAYRLIHCPGNAAHVLKTRETVDL